MSGPLRDHRPLVLNQDDFLVGPGVWQTPFCFLHHEALFGDVGMLCFTQCIVKVPLADSLR